jgi:hypothetical protein
MGPYFFFFVYLNGKKQKFGIFDAKMDNDSIPFKIYYYYAKGLLMVPWSWLVFLFSLAVFIIVLVTTPLNDD